MKELYRKQPYQTRQVSTWRIDSTGQSWLTVAAQTSHTLLEEAGNGIIQRIWLTLKQRAPEQLRAYKLEMFWDQATQAAVSVPLGDFFGVGLGLVPFENALFASPAGRSIICTVPMPFRNGAKIVLTNESDQPITQLNYEISYVLAPVHADDVLYFHACWQRQPQVQQNEPFTILPPVQGHGRFLGTSIHITTPSQPENHPQTVESVLRVFSDEQNSLSTRIGEADNMMPVAQQHQGCLVADSEIGRYSFYRLHLPDAIYFQTQCRAILESPLGSQDRTPIDRAGIAYFYLNRPKNNLSLLAPVAERVHGLSSLMDSAVSGQLGQSLYRPRSLRAKDGGFAFNLQNNLSAATLTALHSLTVDDIPVDLSQVTLITMHGVRRAATAISSEQPLLLPTDTTLRIQVSKHTLQAGTHRIIVGVSLQELHQPVEITILDQLQET